MSGSGYSTRNVPAGTQLIRRLRAEGLIPRDRGTLSQRHRQRQPRDMDVLSWYFTYDEGGGGSRIVGSRKTMRECAEAPFLRAWQTEYGWTEIEPSDTRPDARDTPRAAAKGLTWPAVLPGQTWKAVRGQSAGRTIFIDWAEGGRAGYTLLTKADAASRGQAQASISLKSLWTVYELQEDPDLPEPEPTLEDLVAEIRKYAAPVCADMAEAVVRDAFGLGAKS